MSWIRNPLTVAIALALLAALAGEGVAQRDGRAVRVQERRRAGNERRIALVIGNSAYTRISALRNPANDARAMNRALRESGFQVTTLVDADRRRMLKAVKQFGQQLRKGGVGLFYYAGHGVQAQGRNYLIPLNAEVEGQSDLEYEAVDAGRVLAKMEDAKNRLNIVILDACRNNPFKSGFRSVNSGLAQVSAPTGSLVAYATAPGKVAADGDGVNGLYTEQLIRHMRTPGIKLEEVFKRVRGDVYRRSNGKQVPWENTSVTGDFYFTRAGTGSSAPVVANVPKGPGKSKFSLGRFDAAAKQEEASRKKWNANLREMKGAYGQVQGYERRNVSPQLKVGVWNEFLSAFTQDNPYTSEDDTLRRQAQSRIEHWRGEQQRVARLKADRRRREAEARRQAEARRRNREAEDSRLADERRRREAEARRQAAIRRDASSRTWRDPVTGMEFVKVPGGSFEMGCHANAGKCYSDEKPVRTVRLDGFWLGKHEVTQGQWKRIMGGNPSHFKKGDDYPVERVSWNDAQIFIRRLNSQSSAKFRLPSEAQWEFACRSGGKPVTFGTGNGRVSSGNANYKNNNGGATPVGRNQANSLGLKDMSGNVWEWVQDKFTNNYGNVGTDNPIYERSGAFRVLRGGGWGFFPRGLRCSGRNHGGGAYSNGSLGLRLARSR